jgi:hypothetical protein
MGQFLREFLDPFMTEPPVAGRFDWREASGFNGGPVKRALWRVGLVMIALMGLPFGASGAEVCREVYSDTIRSETIELTAPIYRPPPTPIAYRCPQDGGACEAIYPPPPPPPPRKTHTVCADERKFVE